jgi:hypothetical protein
MQIPRAPTWPVVFLFGAGWNAVVEKCLWATIVCLVGALAWLCCSKAKMSPPIKKLVRLKKAGGTVETISISRITRLNDPAGTMASMIHFDQMKDGTWRLTYNTAHVEDQDALVGIEICDVRV